MISMNLTKFTLFSRVPQRAGLDREKTHRKLWHGGIKAREMIDSSSWAFIFFILKQGSVVGMLKKMAMVVSVVAVLGMNLFSVAYAKTSVHVKMDTDQSTVKSASLMIPKQELLTVSVSTILSDEPVTYHVYKKGSTIPVMSGVASKDGGGSADTFVSKGEYTLELTCQTSGCEANGDLYYTPVSVEVELDGTVEKVVSEEVADSDGGTAVVGIQNTSVDGTLVYQVYKVGQDEPVLQGEVAPGLSKTDAVQLEAPIFVPGTRGFSEYYYIVLSGKNSTQVTGSATFTIEW